MSTLPTGTITFFFTDLVGSSSLWESHFEAMSGDLARHDALLHAAIAENGGYVFSSGGDGLCAAFHTAQEAVRAALAAQRSLHAETWTVGGPGLKARLALHTGEAQERDGDYFGPTLNRTARLRETTHGGQTVLSQVTEQLVRDRLPPGASLRDLGPHRLRDLSRPEQVFHLLHPDLPDDFPPLRSLDQFPHNLPQRLDSFVGREDALAQIGGLLDGHARLVTLTGAGGAGKTRLAQQAAAECLDLFPDGVWFVALEALTDPALVPQAVAAAACVREQPGKSLTETLCEDLRAKRTLLLLDNCEHLIGACAALSHALLQACPGVRVLAISRRHLGVGGEACYPVKPLPLTSSRPDEPSAAVRLFVERATLKHPSFVLTPQNAPAVARICRQLDGIPLAIELAAPRVKMLTPEQISQRLDKDFRLLTGGSRTALPRQQTMQATICWSHDLLSEAECLLFRRLSVFAGGWALGAAEQVCSGDGLDEAEVFDLLSALDDQSLIQAEDDGHGECRYRMLETLRDYSLEHLGPSPDAADTYARHAAYFLALAEQAEPELRGPQQNDWLDRLEAEHDNLRGALSRTVGETRLHLATSLQRFWSTRGYLTEGRRWLEEALRGATADAGKQSVAKALTAAGNLALTEKDLSAAWAFYERARALYGEISDEEGVGRILNNFGIVADFEKNADARRYYEDSLAIMRRLGDRAKIAFVLVNLAAHHIGWEAAEAALPLLEEALPIRRALNDHLGIATVLQCFGKAHCLMGHPLQARADFRQCLTIQWRLGDKRAAADTLYLLADAEASLGRAAEAARLLAASQSLGETLCIPRSEETRQNHDRLESSLRSTLGEDQYTTLRRHAASAPVAQTIVDALE